MILLPDLFFFMLLRFLPILSTSLFFPHYMGGELLVSPTDFWHLSYVHFAIRVILFWSSFQRFPLLLFQFSLFFPFELNIPCKQLKEIMFILQFNFLYVYNFIVQFALIPSFPQGFILLLAEFRSLWLLLFLKIIYLMSFLLVFLKYVGIHVFCS